MLFSNKPLVQKTSNSDIQHRPATTGLDRPSTFYDRTLAMELKEHFKFIPNVDTEETKQENNLVLKKRRIK